jgi:hypothetical protein
MHFMARKQPGPPAEKDWTPESIRVALRKIRRRLTDVEAFDPQTVTRQFDSQVTGLEVSLREMFADVFGHDTPSYRNYQRGAALDTAGFNSNGTPLREVIDGLEAGKIRSITFLKAAIRFFEEKMEDHFPGEPLDQVALSGRSTMMSAGRGGIEGVEVRAMTGPVGPSGFISPGEMRPHGPAESSPTTNIDPFVLNATAEVVPITSEAAFELLMARVAVLEAAIALPKTAGMGHNRGPDMPSDDDFNEAGIQEFIALLKQQSATAPVDLLLLNQMAESFNVENKNRRKYLDELGMGVAKGAGEEIGKRLVQAVCGIPVLFALAYVVDALHTWASTLPPM